MGYFFQSNQILFKTMQKIAVFTSGGDSPGMNAALRAVVRQSLEHGADCFAIQDGFSGMFKGEFRKMEWSDVAGILAKGGTICGTARCKEFRTIEGRRQAAMNLIHLGITGLVCIGGDGSLTGSDILTQEWSSHVEYLLKEKKITDAQAAQCPQLKLVGFTGTIDNDMFGTDATIGVWTALTRIVDAIDCLASTAESHRRCFVVECMGRRAGFLSLTAALVTGAEYTFIPESPPCCDRDDDMTWQTDLCNVLRSCRTKSRASVVVVCEGAIDKNGEKISAEAVRSCIEQEVGVEARLTVLGHVQRGGVPVPADRFIATQMGTRAVQLLLDDGYDGVPLCVGVEGTSVVALPLRDCVDQCQRAAKALDDREFHIAQSLRGSAFEECLRLYRAQHDFLSSDACQAAASTSGARVGILTVGATAPGMATAIAGVARLLLSRGARPLGFRRGFLGLVSATQPIEYDWFSLRDLIASGGSALTCVRHVVGVDVTPEAVAEAIKLQNLDALIVIGGFEAYTSVWRLQQSSTSIDGLKIPMVTIGATISSNLPGSECSIGCDRGVSNLVEAVDNVKQSAVGTRRVFVVEVMGRRCGYLSMIGAMCSGAERVLLPEAPPTLETVARDVQAVRARFEDARDNDKDRCAIWIKNECAGGNVITSTFLCNYFASEAHDLYDVRKSVLGHLQQGGVPTVIDRLVALRLSLATVDRIFDVLKTGDGHCFDHVGLIDGRIVCNSLKDFDKTVNMRERRPLEQWWRKHGLEQDFNVLAQPFAHYFSEANDNRTNNK